MSSSYLVEPQESGSSKKDDTLIIVVNDDGTISVDQETLQNLIMNQSNANVNVVKLGQTVADAKNGDVTLTVDPPIHTASSVSSIGNVVSGDTNTLEDPFMEMDREQLERLENALQSEEAKQILGENVTAMLDMLSVEEQQNSIRHSVELDHCYTSRLSPADPTPTDPLPVVHSPDTEIQYAPSSPGLPPTACTTTSSHDSSILTFSNSRKVVSKTTPKPIGRPRKNSLQSINLPKISGTPGASKLIGTNLQKNVGTTQQRLSRGSVNENEANEDELSSSSESSESEPSDNDSDFGPRGPRRGGIRARGGRKGLTTRGGSMAASRRRGPNKHLDVEQVRRLDMEMAAAVSAMKSPEKDNKSGHLSPVKGRKQIKILGEKKRDESHMISIHAESNPSKSLQSAAQTKPSGSMIKSDILLSKGNQLVVQKQMLIDDSDLHNVTPKKQALLLPKGKIFNQTKLYTTKDGKLVQVPVNSKLVSNTTLINQSKTNVTVQEPNVQSGLLQSKSTPLSSKAKQIDMKKEKRKSEGHADLIQRIDTDPGKIETKVSEDVKKHQRKEHRQKSPGFVSDSLEPALFSTPDIIRRVGSGADMKATDGSSITLLPSTSSTFTQENIRLSVDDNTDLTTVNKENATVAIKQIGDTDIYGTVDSEKVSLMQEQDDKRKTSIKAPLVDELQPSLDSGGIEGEEHLFATLAMEANKPEEELLAEALLLQEELGVDLADHPVLVDQPVSVADTLSTTPHISSSVASNQLLTDNYRQPALQIEELRDSPKKIIKEEKEPVQIVRGGRVITLPPIEAPATRSKKLQEKITPSPKTNTIKKRKDNANVQLMQDEIEQQQKVQINVYEDDDDEDDDEEEEDNSDSEDDPDRLWCICKRPHNNRFMICCDVCEDWFHGKCVHVSKAMGQQMEEKGIEWVCPNCVKKKSDGTKSKSAWQSPGSRHKTPERSVDNINKSRQSISPQKVVTAVKSKAQLTLPVVEKPAGQFSGTMQCVVCKKVARNSSIYCSDACILAHAQETLTKDKPVIGPQQKIQKSATTDSLKGKSDTNRLIVFERKTGKVLAGPDAPTIANLKTWLKENPTYEVLRSNNLNTIQIANKSVTAIQTSGGTKIVKPVTKLDTVPKLVYTKTPGQKQTVLTKKVINASSGGQQVQISPTQSKPVQIKQTILTSGTKLPLMKQTTIKSATVTLTKQQNTAKQTPNKKPETKPAQLQQKPVVKPSPPKKTEPEPIRLNIRKTLTELLSTRIKETDDLNLTDEEIAELAHNIELEMYKYFKDTGAKYKAKYRSLVFNIKDTKNLTLFRKIADKSLTPDAVVRLSPDEMASQELAEWREKETKHQLEMIKKNELDLMSQAKSIVVKTHKGEQIIENDGGMEHVDPQTPVQDIVTALNSGDNITSTVEDEREKDDKFQDDYKKSKSLELKKDKDKEREISRSKEKKKRERSRDRHRRSSRDRDHSKVRDRSKDKKANIKKNKKDKDREREKGKDRDKNKDRERDKERNSRSKTREKHRTGESSSHHRSRSGHSDYKDGKKDEDKKKDDKKGESSQSPTEKSIEDRLWRHIEDEATTNTIDGNDSDVSDREPSSTVNIKTPDINEDHEKEKEPEIDRETNKSSQQTVWRGFVNMVDVAKFFITAQEVSGCAKDLMDDLPDTVDVVGRISHESVWEYILKMKKNNSKEILIIRLTAANDEEKIPYITLYSYLNSRGRLGVVGNTSKNIKDFYIMPFSNQSKLPPVLQPLTGPGFEERRPHLLLGIIVRNKRKRTAPIPNVIAPKMAKKETTDRSYTPPLSVSRETTNTGTPPQSPSYHKSDSVDKQIVTQMTLESLNKAHIGMSRSSIDSATISKIVPELSSKIDLASTSKSQQLDDDDEDAPYSPGEMDDNISIPHPSSSNTNDLVMSPSKNSSELQRKMDELNRQIEEQKQQIQNISSSFLAETAPTLPGLGLDPPSATNDSEEAYSPSDSRSFTPPPQSMSSFSQPILDKVSDITIPPNLQEILANVKRQETTKVDPYLPSKPSATFLTTVNSSMYHNTEKYSQSKSSNSKESKSTLSTLSDLDIIRKAEEELAAQAAATPPQQALSSIYEQQLDSSIKTSLPGSVESTIVPTYKPTTSENLKKSLVNEQPKPPGLEDEELPVFPSTPPTMEVIGKSPPKYVPKSGVVVNVKRKNSDDATSTSILSSPSKTPRTKSRWGQGPNE